MGLALWHVRPLLDAPSHSSSVGAQTLHRRECWFAGCTNVREGLPTWVRKILEHYAAYTGPQGAHSAVLHWCYNVMTRDIPA
jgi:hypothetical protein